MRILYVSNLYPPNDVGGYEQLCFKVASTLVERGHEAVVCTSNYGTRQVDYPGQRIIRALKLLANQDNIYASVDVSAEERSAADRNNVEAFEELCIAERPDLVFVWNLYFLPPGLLNVISNCSIPVAYFLTDNWLAAQLKPNYVSAYFQNEVFRRPNTLRRWRYQFRHGMHVRRIRGTAIFSSHYMRTFYKRAGIKFTSHKVIHNGVSFTKSAFGEPSRIDRSQLKKPGRLSLLFAGRVVDVKGVLSVVRAIPLIIKLCPEVDITCTVIGDQQDRAFMELLRTKCKSLGVLDKFEFKPSVAESQVAQLFDDFDIYLFPSLYEPFSLTLLHAMYAGIPIVATASGGNPEAIKNGHTGLLYRAHDARGLAAAVKRLVDDPALRVRISREASRVSEKFTFEEMIEKLDDYLRSLR